MLCMTSSLGKMYPFRSGFILSLVSHANAPSQARLFPRAFPKWSPEIVERPQASQLRSPNPGRKRAALTWDTVTIENIGEPRGRRLNTDIRYVPREINKKSSKEGLQNDTSAGCSTAPEITLNSEYSPNKNRSMNPYNQDRRLSSRI
jgi:hypothetical protein